MDRKKLTQFLLIFSLANTFLFWLIGLRYLFITVSSHTYFSTTMYEYTTAWQKASVIFFTATTYLGHFTLLAFIPSLLLLPLSYLLPKRRLIIPLAILLWSAAAMILFADNVIFSLFHFHLNISILKIIFDHVAGAVSFLGISPREVTLSIALLIAICLIETSIGWFIWSRIIQKQRKIALFKLFGVLVGCALTSYSAFIITISNGNNVLAQQTPNFPLYNNLIALMLPFNNSSALINLYSETRFSQPLFPVATLHYPLHPLQCDKQTKPYNILIIGIDAWRGDALTEKLTPHMFNFAKLAWTFQHHKSGGNSTQAGLMSLFYGLPANYWNSMWQQQQGALLIHELIQQGYQTHISFSSNMIPRFDKTIFSEIKNLRTTEAPGQTVPDHDRFITDEFQSFLVKRNPHQPFFSFLFYDAVHSYYAIQNIPMLYPTHPDSEERLSVVNTKAEVQEIMNRYRNALHFVDSEVQEILALLRQKKLLDNTIVIITGDHGEEFDDNHRFYWGHGSNYTDYQIHTPFILYWPGHDPKVISYQTSHYDVAPFLLTHILDCHNQASDYSIGENLLMPHTKHYLLVGSYINMGIVEPEKIITLLTSGNIQITDKHINDMPNALPDLPTLTKALHDMRRYYANAE